MFLSTGYSEGLFLLCVAGVLLLLDHGRMWAAATVCAVATATRPTGVCIAAVVVLWALTHGTAPRLRRLALAVGVGVLSIAGLLAHEAYLWRHYGRPDAYYAAQTSWVPATVEHYWTRVLLLHPVLEETIRPIKYTLRGQFGKLADPWTWNRLLNLCILVLAVAGLVRPGPIPRLAFLIPLLMFLMGYLPDPATGSRLVGIARYQLAALPCFLSLARLLTRRGAAPVWALTPAGLVLQCFYVRTYVDNILVS